MKFRYINRVCVIGLLVCSLFFVSCGKKSESLEEVEGVKVNIGSVTKIEGNTFSNYNLDNDKYIKIDNSDTIGLYDFKSDNYIFSRDSKYFSFYNGKEKELTNLNKNDINMMLSPGGKYLSFFSQDDDGIYVPKVISTSNGDKMKFESKVGFSWRDMMWLDEKTLIYYGVSDDRINGIFTYNIEEGKEALFYKLDGGVQFMKIINEEVVFLQETIENKKILKEINISTNEIKEISRDILEINDIVKQNNEYYFLGKTKNSAYSVFKFENSKIKRLVYDFPATINVEKGLGIDSEGNVLFIGLEKNNEDFRIYKYSKDGSVSRFSEPSKGYSFINNIYK